MTATAIGSIKITFAKKYFATYHSIIHKITAGQLVHADETKISICNNDRYVWVFTNMEEVAYVYSESRDASTPREILCNFKGVLVSDFYAGYDSINCAQQKCLIHLMRDINDDLLKFPFNLEMNSLACAFISLLKPIFDTVDQHGLKTRYLKKHKKDVQNFYGIVSKLEGKTELLASYMKRLAKNREKLFTFLEYDDVPWNNNNAEHAIKAFVRLRNVIGGCSTAKGIQEYLILLSIAETCSRKGVSFLNFLRSEEADISAF
jgi:hypothetical protein